MKLVGSNAEGYFYQQGTAPPVFVPRRRAAFAPEDVAHYERGGISPGGRPNRGYFSKVIPGDSVRYVQRPGAPPSVFPPGLVKGEGEFAVAAPGIALAFEGSYYSAAIFDARTGAQISPATALPDGRVRLPARPTTVVYLAGDRLVIAAPGVQVEMSTTPPPQTWTVPFGEPVTIRGIAVEVGGTIKLLTFQS